MVEATTTWRAIEKTPPPENTPVLLHLQYVEWMSPCVVARRLEGKWFVEFDDTPIAYYVTHWRPLPSEPGDSRIGDDDK